MAVKERDKSVTTSINQIGLMKIAGNQAQPRGMGVLTRLQALGYAIFTASDDKQPILGSLLGESDEYRRQAILLIEEHEPELVQLADSIKSQGMLEPIGVRFLKNGAVDVIYGMRRALACAFNRARMGEKFPDMIEAKVFDGKLSNADLIFMALTENEDRDDQSPIDKAMTYRKLNKEEGLSPEEIAAKIKRSSQYVRDYIKLLDKSLEDKRMAIHCGDMSIDRALKLFAMRKTSGNNNAEDSKGGKKKGERARFPSVKNMIKLYESGQRPKSVAKDEWELWTHPIVRKFLAMKLGLKYKEYVETPEAPKKEEKKGKGKKEENTEESTSETPEKKKCFNIPRKKAQDLLVSLGKTMARTWKDEQLIEKLENIVNIVEEGQKAETERLQTLLDKLMTAYPAGYKVKIGD